jgi:hypothetical protein
MLLFLLLKDQCSKSCIIPHQIKEASFKSQLAYLHVQDWEVKFLQAIANLDIYFTNILEHLRFRLEVRKEFQNLALKLQISFIHETALTN